MNALFVADLIPKYLYSLICFLRTEFSIGYLSLIVTELAIQFWGRLISEILIQSPFFLNEAQIVIDDSTVFEIFKFNADPAQPRVIRYGVRKYGKHFAVIRAAVKPDTGELVENWKLESVYEGQDQETLEAILAWFPKDQTPSKA